MLINIYFCAFLIASCFGFCLGTIFLVRLENRPLVLLRNVPPEEQELVSGTHDVVLC